MPVIPLIIEDSIDDFKGEREELEGLKKTVYSLQTFLRDYVIDVNHLEKLEKLDQSKV